jgi:hypothetical protein
VLHNTQEKQDVQVQRNVGLVAQAAKEAKLKLEVEVEMRDLDLKTESTPWRAAPGAAPGTGVGGPTAAERHTILSTSSIAVVSVVDPIIYSNNR